MPTGSAIVTPSDTLDAKGRTSGPLIARQKGPLP
jgi:hypothetical protein